MPYGVVKLASRVPDNVGMRATVKVLGSFVLYTLTYLVVGLTVGTTFGAGWGAVAAAAAPACGYVAVRMMERIHRVGGAVAGYRAVRAGGPATELVRSRRTAVVDAAQSVLGPTVAPGP